MLYLVKPLPIGQHYAMLYLVKPLPIGQHYAMLYLVKPLPIGQPYAMLYLAALFYNNPLDDIDQAIKPSWPLSDITCHKPIQNSSCKL